MPYPAETVFQFTRGDDYQITVTFTNTAGAAQNISAWTNLRAHIREHPDADVKIPVTINTAGAASGVLVFSLTANETRTVPQPAVFDFERTSGGSAQTVVSGMVIASQDVTQ